MLFSKYNIVENIRISQNICKVMRVLTETGKPMTVIFNINCSFNVKSILLQIEPSENCVIIFLSYVASLLLTFF